MLEQFEVDGSAVGGASPDPYAESYSAAKHALRGLIGSIASEQPWFDIKLYEPGYMDTRLLPTKAWPRAKGLAVDPTEEAKIMLQFLRTSSGWLQTSSRSSGGLSHGQS